MFTVNQEQLVNSITTLRRFKQLASHFARLTLESKVAVNYFQRCEIPVC